MSRYDRQRERKRFLIVAAIALAFGGAIYLWGRHTNDGFSTIDQASTKSGQD